ncbi:DUF1992 domain-containing protein [Naasia aerilata]|nr:DUF1992 domain-containing protein [Naasia aerilata]
MTSRRPRPDSRLSAARYRVDRSAPEEDDEESDAGRLTPDQRAGMVEAAIQQAMRRGDFDDLPGTGKPLPDLHQTHDPDWWIRRKIEREQLTGLGPPALTLRKENEELAGRLDATASEAVVRELLHDFNARVIEARRQLLGGPPVITPTRDVEAEVAAWRSRREARLREAEAERDREAAAYAAMTWRERRRARRQR